MCHVPQNRPLSAKFVPFLGCACRGSPSEEPVCATDSRSSALQQVRGRCPAVRPQLWWQGWREGHFAAKPPVNAPGQRARAGGLLTAPAGWMGGGPD